MCKCSIIRPVRGARRDIYSIRSCEIAARECPRPMSSVCTSPYDGHIRSGIRIATAGRIKSRLRTSIVEIHVHAIVKHETFIPTILCYCRPHFHWRDPPTRGAGIESCFREVIRFFSPKRRRGNDWTVPSGETGGRMFGNISNALSEFERSRYTDSFLFPFEPRCIVSLRVLSTAHRFCTYERILTPPLVKQSVTSYTTFRCRTVGAQTMKHDMVELRGRSVYEISHIVFLWIVRR